jgi:hypothetical protein
LAGVYQTMSADCRRRDVPIVWVLVPRVGRPGDTAEQQALKKLALAAGFSAVVDVTDAYDGIDLARLAVDADDFHPNALGHHRLARRLDDAMRELPELRRLWEARQDQDDGHDLASNDELARPAFKRARAETLVPKKPRDGEPR